MPADFVNKRQRVAPAMIWITLLAGVTSFVYQFMLDGALLTFMVTAAAIGGLAGSSKGFDEHDRLLLWQSYAKAFEIFFMAIFFIYAFTLLAGWLNVGGGVIAFLNEHWLSTAASGMCIILGATGLRYFYAAEVLAQQSEVGR